MAQKEKHVPLRSFWQALNMLLFYLNDQYTYDTLKIILCVKIFEAAILIGIFGFIPRLVKSVFAIIPIGFSYSKFIKPKISPV